MGKVESFNLDGLNVVVQIRLKPEANLPQDSYAELKSLGMVGEKFIDIIPGESSVMLKEGDFISGQTASDLMEMTGTVKGLIQRTEEVLAKVSLAFENVFDH